MSDVFRWRRLLAVHAVYRYKSALKAADVVHMSQPAVTGAVASCERLLDAALFTRTSRGMEPTRAGHVFCRRIEAAMAHLKAAEALLHQKRGGARIPIHRLVTDGQLRALSAVIETGGFSEAARRLNLAQPSVFRSARELETLVGVPLFRKDGATVEPTPEARLLARHGDLALRELTLGLDELAELQGVIEGSITVGALPLARSKWLPEAIASTLAQFPLAQIRIVDGPYDVQLEALLHGRVDMILGALRDPLPSKQVMQEHCFDDPLVIVVRGQHPLAAGFDSSHDKLTPDQLAGLAWILPRAGTPGRANFEAFMAAKGLASPRRVIECSSLVAIRALVMDNDYAALLSAQQVELEVSQGLLKIMGPPLTGSMRAIGIAQRVDFRPTRLQEAFLGHLRDGAGGGRGELGKGFEPQITPI